MAQLCTNAPPITNSALNGSQLHQCLLTHSECTQPTQIKCSMNRMCTSTLNDSNQDLQCWNAHMHIQCFEIPPKSTNPALVHLQTRDGLQNLKAPLRALQNSSKAPKAPPRTFQKWKLPPPTNTKPQDICQCTQAIKPLIMQLTCVGP